MPRRPRAAGAHYLDLTEDVASTRAVKQLAAGARTAFIPQCGLAPGFITIVASDLASHFDELQDVRMRVGALPKFPSNALNYNLTWSTDGVINEYCEPCEAIVNGQLRETKPLEELEEFSLDGVLYEAFNTSGGLGTLCETLAGKVRNLNYRTIRYPGHAAIMKALLNDLRLRDRRELLKRHPGERGADHAAGRGDHFRHGQRQARRPARAGDLCEQGLRRAHGRPRAQRHSDHHRGRHLRGARHAAAKAICRSPVSSSRKRSALPAFLANRFGRVYAMPGRRRHPTPPEIARAFDERRDVGERGGAPARAAALSAATVSACMSFAIQLERHRHAAALQRRGRDCANSSATPCGLSSPWISSMGGASARTKLIG